MILYFTGTGNSEYVAKRIAAGIDDEIFSIAQAIKAGQPAELHADSPWVICSPTYGWQLPHIVRDWLKKVALSGSDRIYFVLTCGDGAGNAAKFLRNLCRKIGKDFYGCQEIIMPENYIAMFNAPQPEEAVQIVASSEPAIDTVIQIIKSKERIPEKKTGIIDRLLSSVVNAIYYPTCISARKFYAKDSCTGCGLCEKLCPTNTIRLSDGKPTWGKGCTHCMACICHCPVCAIEYGKTSVGKPRYTCPVSPT